MAKRKKYTEEFKREAVRLLESRGERTISDVAHRKSKAFPRRKRTGETLHNVAYATFCRAAFLGALKFTPFGGQFDYAAFLLTAKCNSCSTGLA
jgi:hypothetical protein